MGRPFYALLVSQTATNLSFALYIMAVIMHLHEATGSTALAAAVTLTSMGARMVSGMVLPVFSGRLPLSALVKTAQLVQLVFLGGLVYLVQLQQAGGHLWWIFLLVSAVSFCNGFFTPMKSTMVKLLVPEQDRVRANSLLASVDQTFLFAGWTFGGLVLSVAGKDFTMGIAMALILISLLSFPKARNNTAWPERSDGLITRLTAGWRHLFRHPVLRTIVTMDMVEAWTGTIWIGAITLAFVKEALGQDESWWGYINGAYYLGTIAGGLLVYRLSRVMKRRLTFWMLFGSMTFGLLTFVYGWVSNPYVALALVLLTGPCYQIRDIAQETMVQNSADEKELPKILAARSALTQLIFMVSIVTVGGLTDLIGVRFVYIASGGLLMMTALAVLVRWRTRQNDSSPEREIPPSAST